MKETFVKVTFLIIALILAASCNAPNPVGGRPANRIARTEPAPTAFIGTTANAPPSAYLQVGKFYRFIFGGTAGTAQGVRLDVKIVQIDKDNGWLEVQEYYDGKWEQNSWININQAYHCYEIEMPK